MKTCLHFNKVYCLLKLCLAALLSFICLYPVSAHASTVRVDKTELGWQLLVDGKPFMVKGIVYTPTAIGESSHDNTRRNWLYVDDDKDGRNDYAYQTWVDKNLNNERDPDEPEVGDFELMRRMGVNTIRIYHHASNDPELEEINAPGSLLLNHAPNKQLLRELHNKYDIWVAMGDLVGAYTVSSGADWNLGTDYTDPQQRLNMLKSVEVMVRTHKDEPYILMWILGNENNFEQFTHTQASKQPEAYAKFINEAARLIKSIDPNHPVVLCNGALGLINYYGKHSPDIDIFGLNIYHDNGFYELWKKIARQYDRPVILTEYGTAHPLVKAGKHNEKNQARIHRSAWQDIENHQHGKKFPANAIGGFAFQWVDEWWANGNKWLQNTNPDGSGWNHEYNGIASLGDGSAGSLTRQLRKVYYEYQQLWKEE